MICQRNIFLVLDTRVFVEVCESGSGDIPGRLENWVKEAVDEADEDAGRHAVGFVVSVKLFKEYQFRITQRFRDRRLNEGLEFYFQKRHGIPSTIVSARGDFLFVPYNWSAPQVSMRLTDNEDTKLLEILINLLGKEKYSDRIVLFGCKDNPTAREIMDICVRKPVFARNRLAIGDSPARLKQMIANH